MKMTKSTESSSDAINRLSEAVKNADAVVIGAGAGLSTSAGFIYSGERFDKYFDDFGKKYGFSNMYEGGFYPYDTLEEHWAYWSRYIYVNRYMDAPKPVYHNLFEVVKDKDYFVITTNVDHCFQKAGFDKERLFYTQGDFGLFQCSKPCHEKTYDNEEIVRKMVMAQGLKMEKDGDFVAAGNDKIAGMKMQVLSDLVPNCPVCGRPMSMNLRADETFVEDEGWYRAAKRYDDFLQERMDKKILFLELGVGYNTPSIIKYPFWQMTGKNKDAVYACINVGEAFVPDEISGSSICIDADIGEVLEKMAAK